MKRQPKTLTVTREPGQVQASGGDMYLYRQTPIWSNPQWLTSDVWRAYVRKQPIAVLCREAITNHLLSLDWNITSRDSEQQDELKEDIKYYTRLLERGHAYYTSMDFSSHIEWIVKDLFDLPFGAASEIGREYNSSTGKVVWIKPIDAGTLAPTLNFDFPVVQHFPNYQPVVFQKEFISRIYLSPRTEIQREGWGMPPPERIYLAMEMLNRGDIYYSQLLLNTPEAGILDLMDMDKESATEWVTSFRDLLYGINPLKIPVLYEHTSEAKWIPFGKLPSDILYDTVTSRYITILCAGYGLTSSDIGIGSSSNGGETLSGTIRQERTSARSGKALAKKKLKAYFEQILPEELKFDWVDFDDEKNVALSRARMANANAASIWIQNQVYSPDEIRRQGIADGMFTITIPETLDRKKIEWPQHQLTYQGVKNSPNAQGGGGTKLSNSIGSPKAPSGGGQGEIKPQQIISKSRQAIEISLTKAIYGSNQVLGSLINSVRTNMNDFPKWEGQFEQSVIGKSYMDLLSETIIDDTYNSMSDLLVRSDWLDTVSVELARLFVDNYNAKQLLVEDFVEPINPFTLDDVRIEIGKALKGLDNQELINRIEKVGQDLDSKLHTMKLENLNRENYQLTQLASAKPEPIPQQPSVVNVTLPPIEFTANLPETTTHMNFSPNVQASEVVVQNNTPIENIVNVEKADMNVTVEPTPIVINNQNDITVQPAEVTVIQPPNKPREVEIVRDADGRMTKLKPKE